MNNVFNFKRFGQYLAYSLKYAWSRVGLSLIICAAMPFFVFATEQIFSLLIFGEFSEMSLWVRLITVWCMFAVCSIYVPTKLYGRLTDKRYGSDYLMIPVSMPEKFVSLLAVLLVVVPVAFVFVFLLVDLLMGLILPNLYGTAVLMRDCSFFFGSPMYDGFDFGINWFWCFYANWLCSVLAFALGAMVFKKSKIVKTFLVIFLVSIIWSVLATFGIVAVWDSASFQVALENDSIYAVNWLNVSVNLQIAFIAVVLAVLVYVRMKTIKH